MSEACKSVTKVVWGDAKQCSSACHVRAQLHDVQQVQAQTHDGSNVFHPYCRDPVHVCHATRERPPDSGELTVPSGVTGSPHP